MYMTFLFLTVTIEQNVENMKPVPITQVSYNLHLRSCTPLLVGMCYVNGFIPIPSFVGIGTHWIN